MKKLFLTLIVALATLCGFAQKNKTVEYPFFRTKNTRVFDITKVTTSKEYTALEVYFYAADWIKVNSTSILTGNNSGKKYKLLRSEGVDIDQETALPVGGYMKATLYFEPLDATDRSFDFSEGDNVPNGWEITNISLTPCSLKKVLEKDKKWGKKSVSPFAREYCSDSIRIELDINGSDEKFEMYYMHGLSFVERKFSNGKYSYSIPAFNTITIIAYFPNNDYKALVASPGDTIRISYDGASRQAKAVTADNEMQRCIDEYKRYNRASGIYESPVGYALAPQQLFYDNIAGTLKRNMMRLQNFIDEHPGFNEKAAYFLRTGIKTETLRELLQYRFNIRKQQQKFFSKETMALIDELFTDIVNPLTMSSSFDRIMIDYAGYKNDLSMKGLRVALNANTSNAMRTLNSIGEIKLSKKEIATIEKGRYLQSLVLAKALNMIDDTVKAAQELKDSTIVIKRYNALLKKYAIDKLTKSEIENYFIAYDYLKVGDGIKSLPITDEDKKFAVTFINYEELSDGNKSLNDTVLEIVMRGLEDFPTARHLVEQNNYMRKLEAQELEVKYLRNCAELTPETLKADSLLASILEPHKGKVVYVDFWGTWCSPCKEQMSYVPAIKEALKGKDVVFLYFADNSPEDVRQTIVKRFGIYGENTFHYNLPDEQQHSLKELLNVNSFPTYLLFDKHGKLIDRTAPRPQQKDMLLNEIQKLLDE